MGLLWTDEWMTLMRQIADCLLGIRLQYINIWNWVIWFWVGNDCFSVQNIIQINLWKRYKQQSINIPIYGKFLLNQRGSLFFYFLFYSSNYIHFIDGPLIRYRSVLLFQSCTLGTPGNSTRANTRKEQYNKTSRVIQLSDPDTKRIDSSLGDYYDRLSSSTSSSVLGWPPLAPHGSIFCLIAMLLFINHQLAITSSSIQL